MIQFSIPARNPNPNITINPSVPQIQGVLDSLPLANARESCKQILLQLRPLNRAPLEVNVRNQIMGLILPLLDDLINSVRSGYINGTLPLIEKQQQVADMIQDLLNEVAYGYKIIVKDLMDEQVNQGTSPVVLSQAIYYAMCFLSRQVLDCYALYKPEPPKIWLELNQLYLFAEQNNFHDIGLNPINAAAEPSPATISNIYRRIILLTLANPYHLMQGEAVKMYKRLIEWAPNCDILALRKTGLPEGKLFVDLNMDAPPLFTPKGSGNIQPKQGRLLEIKNVLGLLNKEIRKTATRNSAGAMQSSLTQRMDRDMYFRWSEAWGVRRERMSHRVVTHMPTQVICSLTLAHSFISGEQPFNPEESEMRIRGEEAKTASSSSLSLMPEETTPWESERGAETQTSTEGLQIPRESQFDLGGQSQKDIWIKVFATSAQAVRDLTGEAEVEYNIYDCQIENTNQGGFGLKCDTKVEPPARVGELLASRTGDEPDEEAWAIGVIRWAKVESDSVHLGVRTIADDAYPIAVKAVAGVGVGGEYYRALLTPNLDPEQYPTTIVVPAAVYDIDSVLMVNLEDRILYARLTRQLEATTAFSHYQFDLVRPPERAEDMDPLQEERISSRLFK